MASSEENESLFLGQVFAGYRLDGKGGRGGFCKVLRATRLSDGKAVAIKVLRSKYQGKPRRERQLMREGRILSTLDHPRILRCLDVGRAGAWVFLCLPWIEGEPLSMTLTRGPLEPPLALDCAFQLLEALEYVHRKGVVHQDVKPDNVLIDRRRRCYLFDFGLALRREDMLRERASGGVARIVGSSSYRAPEQEDPKGTVDSKADMYAFGVTLHRLLSGKLPVERKPDPSLPSEIAEWIERCLSLNPRERPSASQLRKALAP